MSSSGSESDSSEMPRDNLYAPPGYHEAVRDNRLGAWVNSWSRGIHMQPNANSVQPSSDQQTPQTQEPDHPSAQGSTNLEASTTSSSSVQGTLNVPASNSSLDRAPPAADEQARGKKRSHAEAEQQDDQRAQEDASPEAGSGSANKKRKIQPARRGRGVAAAEPQTSTAQIQNADDATTAQQDNDPNLASSSDATSPESRGEEHSQVEVVEDVAPVEEQQHESAAEPANGLSHNQTVNETGDTTLWSPEFDAEIDILFEFENDPSSESVDVDQPSTEVKETAAPAHQDDELESVAQPVVIEPQSSSPHSSLSHYQPADNNGYQLDATTSQSLGEESSQVQPASEDVPVEVGIEFEAAAVAAQNAQDSQRAFGPTPNYIERPGAQPLSHHNACIDVDREQARRHQGRDLDRENYAAQYRTGPVKSAAQPREDPFDPQIHRSAPKGFRIHQDDVPNLALLPQDAITQTSHGRKRKNDEVAGSAYETNENLGSAYDEEQTKDDHPASKRAKNSNNAFTTQEDGQQRRPLASLDTTTFHAPNPLLQNHLDLSLTSPATPQPSRGTKRTHDDVDEDEEADETHEVDDAEEPQPLAFDRAAAAIKLQAAIDSCRPARVQAWLDMVHCALPDIERTHKKLKSRKGMQVDADSIRGDWALAMDYTNPAQPRPRHNSDNFKKDAELIGMTKKENAVATLLTQGLTMKVYGVPPGIYNSPNVGSKQLCLLQRLDKSTISKRADKAHELIMGKAQSDAFFDERKRDQRGGKPCNGTESGKSSSSGGRKSNKKVKHNAEPAPVQEAQSQEQAPTEEPSQTWQSALDNVPRPQASTVIEVQENLAHQQAIFDAYAQEAAAAGLNSGAPYGQEPFYPALVPSDDWYTFLLDLIAAGQHQQFGNDNLAQAGYGRQGQDVLAHGMEGQGSGDLADYSTAPPLDDNDFFPAEPAGQNRVEESGFAGEEIEFPSDETVGARGSFAAGSQVLSLDMDDLQNGQDFQSYEG